MITRTSELKQLQKVYEEPRNSLVLLYGSTRSDKELLIREFVQDKKYFYYRARNASVDEQLRQFKAQVEAEYDVKLQKNTYDEGFTRIKSGDSSRLVVIIDEFQTIAKKDPSFFSSILKLKKKLLYPGPVMIILLNSSIAWTREDMEDALGDDVDAIDTTISLSEVGFLEIVRAFPKYSVADCVSVYGVLDGVPEYLNRWDGNRSIRDNICALILDRRGFLHSEAESFIGNELRELSVYDTILASMARGNEKLNDLYVDTGYSRAKISVYLKNLATFDIIEKTVSFETGGWDNTVKGVYRIRQPFVDFWFHFVYPHLSELTMMSPAEFYDRYIENELKKYLRRYFPAVCREYLELMNRVGKVSINVRKMGTWIGKSGTIDIIGQDDELDYVVGICNWDEPELTFDSYQDLLNNMKLAKIHARTMYLFSATSFDGKLRELEKNENTVVLVDMTEL